MPPVVSEFQSNEMTVTGYPGARSNFLDRLACIAFVSGSTISLSFAGYHDGGVRGSLRSFAGPVQRIGFTASHGNVAAGNPYLGSYRGGSISNALLFRSDGTTVGVVNADGKVEIRKIAIGLNLGDKLEISQGLSVTDQVIVNPSDSLANGMTVEILNQKQPSVDFQSLENAEFEPEWFSSARSSRIEPLEAAIRRRIFSIGAA
jgi:hypothetical protein